MGRKLGIPPDLVESWFEDSIACITSAVMSVLAEYPDISVVCMVGGYSASPLLQKELKSALGIAHPDVSIRVPARPGLAIVSQGL